MTPEEKLASLGIELPEVPAPLGSYVPAVTSGNLVFISGMLPLKDGKLLKTGKFGDSLSKEEGAELARVSAINALSVLKAHMGDLRRVRRCVRLCGYIASTSDFIDQPSVLNGASSLMSEVFGEEGRHARAAVGVNVLPMNSPIEIEFVFEVEAAD